jgi:hypothetical protein
VALSLNTCSAKIERAKEHSAALEALRAATLGEELDVLGFIPGQIAVPDFPPPYPIGIALPDILIRTVEKIVNLFEPLT